MAFEHKPNSGSIFKNDKRETDSQPNGKGDALIEGVEYWISAWTNDGTKGKYQSLKFERKDKKDAPKPSSQRPAGGGFHDVDPDIPF